MLSSCVALQKFIWEDKHWRHPNPGILLKEFCYYDHSFCNHTVAIMEGQSAVEPDNNVRYQAVEMGWRDAPMAQVT